MKKTKKILGLVATLLSTVSLTGCKDVTEKGKVVLTYNGSEYTVDDLFGHYEYDKTSSQTMFDAVYKVAVQNFYKTSADDSLKERVQRDAQNDLDQAKQDAQNNANNNSTSYNEEFIKILRENDSTDEASLKDHYEYNHMKEEFTDLIYDKNLESLKIGDGSHGNGKVKIGDTETTESFSGSYVEDKFPYHIKHILVKIQNTSTNPFQEKISEEQVDKLYTVIKQLGLGKDSFGQIAKDNSDDEGSKENFGDLGIMDKDTSFVNEFKLGLYAYDAYYNTELNDKEKVKEKLDIPEGSETYLGTNFLSEITIEKLNELYSVRKETKDENNALVEDGAEELYPRNIYFNLNFNKKNINYITAEQEDLKSLFNLDPTGDLSPYLKSPSSKKCGFMEKSQVKGVDTSLVSGTYVLTDENDYPILAFRSGTGGSSDSEGEESSSGYRGIHLLSIVRNGFAGYNETTVPEVKQSDYWTYYYPGESGYPTDSSDNDLLTYVNSIKSETKDYKKKADEVKTKIKNYQSDFDTYIYRALKASGNLSFSDSDIGKLINNNIEQYININRNESQYLSSKNWEKTWLDWTENLKTETNIKYMKVEGEADPTKHFKYLINETCAINFKEANGAQKSLFEPGGLCYVK